MKKLTDIKESILVINDKSIHRFCWALVLLAPINIVSMVF